MAWLFIDGKTRNASIGRMWEDKRTGQDHVYQYFKGRRRKLRYHGVTDEYTSISKWKRWK